uniref:Uncharacterized protein n=1 Tax=Kalanchoe fedtschenkoi TaxID=63787 RepID=A0A7N0U949_KALFE
MVMANRSTHRLRQVPIILLLRPPVYLSALLSNPKWKPLVHGPLWLLRGCLPVLRYILVSLRHIRTDIRDRRPGIILLCDEWGSIRSADVLDRMRLLALLLLPFQNEAPVHDQGQHVRDLCTHYCCECFALCQEYRELQHRGFDMALGWKGNVESWRGHGGVQMAPSAPHLVRSSLVWVSAG